MQNLDRSATRPVPSPTTLPRLMPGDHLDDYRTHIECFGPRPRGNAILIAEIERAGLRGHGGAGFPTATKLAAVARQRRGGYVVANATEGEPMSTKDKTLCATAPHLVLDGAAIAAETVRAAAVVVCVDRSAPRLAQILTRAVAARASLGADTVPVRVTAAPDRYVAGEESALVRWLNGFDAKPTFVPPRPFEKGVGNRPTLVQNVETLAHIALIARYGAPWFRGIGTNDDPGSALVTVSGAVADPAVFEIPLGLSLPDLVAAAGGTLDASQALLIGGYFGTWIRTEHARRVALSNEGARAAGGGFGCGLVVALPATTCGLLETAGVVQYLADETAGQCGPCVHGLGAIARAMVSIAYGEHDQGTVERLRRWIDDVSGRGACHYPDGAVRFVASALDVFGDEIDCHARQRGCALARRARVLSFPDPARREWGWR